MKTRIHFWMVLLTLGIGPAAFAGQPTLKIGDPAPKLQNGDWVQGDPVTEFDHNKAYIVEFWATWCGPCKASIPHLNEHYLKFKDKDLVVIGQDCWEHDDSVVAPFVKSMGEKMTYRVALDDKKTDPTGVMAKTWMAAAGQNGIPAAFLIGKDGRIAWIGHPMTLEDSVIEDVLAGKYDVNKAAADYAEKTRSQAHLTTAWQEFNTALRAQKWDEALTKLDETEKLLPEDRRPSLEVQHFSILISKNDIEGAFKLAGQISDAHPDNVVVQNQLAWQIVSNPTIETPDLALAEKIATRAVVASTNKNADVLDTLACVFFMEGKQDKAVSLQEQAVSLAMAYNKPALQKTLECYKKGTNKPDLLNWQAAQFKKDGKLAEAEAAWREELALEQKLWETNAANWRGTAQQLISVLTSEKKTDDVEKLYSAILTPDFANQKESAGLLRDRGNYFAKRGRFKEAAADLTRVVELAPGDQHDYYVLAPLLVQCNDLEAYQRLCAEMLARFGDTTEPMVAERMAKDCLITTNSGIDLATITRLVDFTITTDKTFPWFQFAKGMEEYRQGHFAAAEEHLQLAQSSAIPYLSAGSGLVLAMAQYQLKQPDDARVSLDKAVEIINTKIPKIDKGEIGDDMWNDWNINQVLLREARGLIGNPVATADRAARDSSK